MFPCHFLKYFTTLNTNVSFPLFPWIKRPSNSKSPFKLLETSISIFSTSLFITSRQCQRSEPTITTFMFKWHTIQRMIWRLISALALSQFIRLSSDSYKPVLPFFLQKIFSNFYSFSPTFHLLFLLHFQTSLRSNVWRVSRLRSHPHSIVPLPYTGLLIQIRLIMRQQWQNSKMEFCQIRNQELFHELWLSQWPNLPSAPF